MDKKSSAHQAGRHYKLKGCSIIIEQSPQQPQHNHRSMPQQPQYNRHSTPYHNHHRTRHRSQRTP